MPLGGWAGRANKIARHNDWHSPCKRAAAESQRSVTLSNDARQHAALQGFKSLGRGSRERRPQRQNAPATFGEVITPLKLRCEPGDPPSLRNATASLFADKEFPCLMLIIQHFSHTARGSMTSVGSVRSPRHGFQRLCEDLVNVGSL